MTYPEAQAAARTAYLDGIVDRHDRCQFRLWRAQRAFFAITVTMYLSALVFGGWKGLAVVVGLDALMVATRKRRERRAAA